MKRLLERRFASALLISCLMLMSMLGCANNAMNSSGYCALVEPMVFSDRAFDAMDRGEQEAVYRHNETWLAECQV